MSFFLSLAIVTSKPEEKSSATSPAGMGGMGMDPMGGIGGGF